MEDRLLDLMKDKIRSWELLSRLIFDKERRTMATEKLSPGMQQYVDIKKQYPDAFLLFRMGDFYELFYEDAVNAAQILEFP